MKVIGGHVWEELIDLESWFVRELCAQLTFEKRMRGQLGLYIWVTLFKETTILKKAETSVI